MSKAKAIIKKVRVILLLVFLLFAVVAIYPSPGREGVAIRSIARNSSASIAGIESPQPGSSPMSREIVISVNNQPIANLKEYYDSISGLEPNRTVNIRTNKGYYRLITKAETETIVLNGTVKKKITETVEKNKTVNGTIVFYNETVDKIKYVPKTETKVIGMEDIGLVVYNAPTSNIVKGLDLQGGTRVLLQPEEKVSSSDMEIILENMKERLNVYGLSDVVVRETSDLSGNQFILVEVAGSNDAEVRELLSKQGKFEAKIANESIFKGGDDITYVCRSADCSGIDPTSSCRNTGDGWVCSFMFSISLSPDAAQRQADATRDLELITEGKNQYLSQQLDLYLDNELVDSLNIGSDLQGRAVTDIAISGPGVGSTQQEAMFDALKGMKKLQTILITGSLPVKIEIVKTDSISPVLGEQFTKNAIFIGILAILSVAIIVFIRYRKLEIAIPMMFTMFSEVVLLLGLASLIRWNLDLAAIAGIIIAAGTGVDDQIVITDEVMRGEVSSTYNWKQKIKKAFFIIIAAYFTTVVAMVPLLFAGAGLLKGFAFTTIAGVSFGVFVTRPAFAAVIEILLKK